MRARRIVSLALLLLIVVAIVLFFLLRDGGEELAPYGAAYALCPGPDQFGYRCAGAGGVSYVDAGEDIELYADEGSQQLSLPFPFTFYGVAYEKILVGSNGTVHFGGDLAADFVVRCLDEGPVDYLGEMLAVYWDDLDSRAEGAVQIEVVGAEPNRVFVIEWEGVLRFLGEPEDSLTFEVQLFESSNQIAYLYKDVTTLENANGANALVGLQSVALDTTLTYSCRDDAVADRSGVTFLYPPEPNPEFPAADESGLPSFDDTPAGPVSVAPKGDVALLVDELARSGLDALPSLRLRWLSDQPGREASWQQADLTGDDRDELLVLWRGPAAYPELARLAIIAFAAPGEPATVLWDGWLSGRSRPFAHPAFGPSGDVTGDGLADLLVLDEDSLALLIVSRDGGQWQSALLAEPCKGRLALADTDGDPALEIVREQCPSGERVSFDWPVVVP